MIDLLLQHPLAEQLGRVLVHSLWQGLALWIVLVIGLRLIPAGKHSLRHTFSAAILIIWLAAPALTWISMTQPGGSPLTNVRTEAVPGGRALPVGPTETNEPGPAGAESVAPVARAESSRPASVAPSRNLLLPGIALAWLTCSALLVIRYLGGLLLLSRLIRSGRGVPQLQTVFFNLLKRMRISSHVRLLESRLVDSPVALGLFRPAVLLPASAITGLSAQQLELILAHELAHIRRHDYLVSLLQGLAEALLFYHPLTWILSKVLLNEREHACDEMALRASGAKPVELAAALASLEGSRPMTQPLLAANGNLRTRIAYLLQTKEPISKSGPAPVTVATAVIGALLGFMLLTAQAADKPAPLVVIDPGHSTEFSGASANGIIEAELNLFIARRVQVLLGEAGVESRLTREGDEALAGTLAGDQVARAAVAEGATAFISLHAGAASNSAFRGIRSYVSPSSESAEASRELAGAVHEQLVQATGANDQRIVEQDALRILELVAVPAVLVEYGQMSNVAEAGLLRNPEYQEQIAVAIAAGIVNHLAANQVQLVERSASRMLAPVELELPESGW